MIEGLGTFTTIYCTADEIAAARRVVERYVQGGDFDLVLDLLGLGDSLAGSRGEG
jgi:hypothetical protein